MRLSNALLERNIWRQFTRKWRLKRFVRVENLSLKKAIEAKGKQVHDAATLFGLDSGVASPRPLKIQTVAHGEAYEKKLVVADDSLAACPPPAYVYSGQNLVFNLDQALALTNTVVVSDSLPPQVQSLEQGFEVDELITKFHYVIKDKLLLDATQKKLPKVVDITRLGLPQRRRYGIPHKKAYVSMLYGLMELCDRSMLTSGHPIDCRSLLTRTISLRPDLMSLCHSDGEERLVMERSPDVMLTSPHALPTLCSTSEVQETGAMRTPDLSPASAYTHLPLSNTYNYRHTALVGGNNVHLVMFGDWMHLRHLLTADTLSAKSLMMLYLAATAAARQQGVTVECEVSGRLSRPVVVQCVGFDGQLMQLSALQLNSLQLPACSHLPPSSERQLQLVKNQLWIQPARKLFEECGFIDGRLVLNGVDDTFLPQLLAMYAYGLRAGSVDSSAEHTHVN